MPSDRLPTSTLEFLVAVDSSAAKLPTFEPSVSTHARRGGQAVVFVALLATGLLLAVIAAFLLR